MQCKIDVYLLRTVDFAAVNVSKLSIISVFLLHATGVKIVRPH